MNDKEESKENLEQSNKTKWQVKKRRADDDQFLLNLIVVFLLPALIYIDNNNQWKITQRKWLEVNESRTVVVNILYCCDSSSRSRNSFDYRLVVLWWDCDESSDRQRDFFQAWLWSSDSWKFRIFALFHKFNDTLKNTTTLLFALPYSTPSVGFPGFFSSVVTRVQCFSQMGFSSSSTNKLEFNQHLSNLQTQGSKIQSQ